MRRSHRCPKCDHHEVLYVPEVRDSDHDRLAMAGRTSLWTSEEQGGFEAYMCRACGYTELYTRDPEAIPVDGTLVRELDGGRDDKGGPYR